MSLFAGIAGIGLDAYLSMEGFDVRYTPTAGTGEVVAQVAAGPRRQDEMILNDGQTRKLMQQMLIRRTGTKGIAEPRFEDVFSRGDSQNLEEWQIVDIIEQNAVVTIANCRRRHRNEVSRTGYRT